MTLSHTGALLWKYSLSQRNVCPQSQIYKKLAPPPKLSFMAGHLKRRGTLQIDHIEPQKIGTEKERQHVCPY